MPTPKPKTVDARIDVRMAAERSKNRSPTRAPTTAPAIAPRSPPRGNRPRSRLYIRAWDGLSVPNPRWLRASVARSSTRDVIPALLGLNLDRLLRSHLDPPVVTSLNEIECLRRSHWGSAGKGRSAPSEAPSEGRATWICFSIAATDRGGGVATIPWIIAAIFVIGGIVTLLRGARCE